MSPAPVHVMVDIETLATTQDAVILSIGATEMFGSYPRTFYEKLDRFNQPQRKVDPATLEWWETQDKEIRNEAFAGNLSIYYALTAFNNFLLGCNAPVNLWANSPSFDLAILRHAMGFYKIKPAWSFRDERDYRTVMALFPLKDENQYVKGNHNALADAQAQAANLTKAIGGPIQWHT